jgi:putative transcriptional regulator
MGLMDSITFEPDEELRRFIENYDQYGPQAEWPDESEPEIDKILPYRGRTASNQLFAERNTRILTQAQLAARIGTTRRTISAIENNKREPSVYLALAIAETLGCKVEDIFRLSPSAELPTSKY